MGPLGTKIERKSRLPYETAAMHSFLTVTAGRVKPTGRASGHDRRIIITHIGRTRTGIVGPTTAKNEMHVYGARVRRLYKFKYSAADSLAYMYQLNTHAHTHTPAFIRIIRKREYKPIILLLLLSSSRV